MKKTTKPAPVNDEPEPGFQTQMLLAMAQDPPKIVHRGTHLHRLKEHPLELAFAKLWEEQNDKYALLRTVLGDGSIGAWEKVKITQAEATAAATAIQWLGSPVGRCHLADILRSPAGREFLKSYLGAVPTK